MFGLKKFIPLKVVASNNFLSALSNNINEAKEKLAVSVEASQEIYEKTFYDSFEAFKRFIFSDGNDENSFHDAANGLAKASELKPIKPEPYFYLSCLFHLCGENETALNTYRQWKLSILNLKGYIN